MAQSQRGELFAWRTSVEGKAVIEANQTKNKAKRDAKNQKLGDGGGNAGGGGNTVTNESKAYKATNKRLQKKFQAAVVKVSKKLVASSIEAEKAECAAADLSLDAAIKRQGNAAAVISATLVVEDDDAEKKFTQKQTAIKLLAVKSRINKLKKDVSF